mgnify:CR=1 FL=1
MERVTPCVLRRTGEGWALEASLSRVGMSSSGTTGVNTVTNVNGLLIFSTHIVAATATPSVYKTTVTKVELCSSSACADPIVLGSGSKLFDIASVSAQADVGTYLNDFTITLGRTYTHVRSTINATMTTKGTVDVSGTTCNTVASPTVAASSATATDGSISTTTYAGNPPYSYLWSNGSNDTIIDSLAPGLYNLVISDAYSCYDTVSFQINEPNQLVHTDTFTLCDGDSVFRVLTSILNKEYLLIHLQVVWDVIALSLQIFQFFPCLIFRL